MGRSLFLVRAVVTISTAKYPGSTRERPIHACSRCVQGAQSHGANKRHRRSLDGGGAVRSSFERFRHRLPVLGREGKLFITHVHNSCTVLRWGEMSHRRGHVALYC